MNTDRVRRRRPRAGFGELVSVDEPLPPRRPRRAALSVDLDGVNVAFAFHAIERFRLRTCPHLRFDQARTELEQDLARHRRQHDRPEWLHHTHSVLHRTMTDSYLVINERLCFPLVSAGPGPAHLLAVTCIQRDDALAPIASAA